MAARALVQGLGTVGAFNASTGVTTLNLPVLFIPDDGREPFSREVPVNVNLSTDTLNQLATKVGSDIRAFASNPIDVNLTIPSNAILCVDFIKL